VTIDAPVLAVLAGLAAGLALAGLAVAVAVLARRLRELAERQGSPGAALEVLQREVESVRGQVSHHLLDVQRTMSAQLGEVTAEVNRRLQEGLALMQAGQSTMGQRLEHASEAVRAVEGQLGTLTEATRRVEQVGRDVAGLEQILRAPKVRGGLGEILLERLLADILPADGYRMQHAFRGGDTVDAVIVVAGRLVPIDSKFPLENFRRVLDEADDDRRARARRAFLRDVRNRVDEIAKKYIVPDEGTFDFALMYIPAEHVYYEAVLREESGTGDDSLLRHALSRRVVPVSPNSFHAYLQVILLGLRGLRIEQNAREILGVLGRLSGDLARFREQFDTLGRHLGNARNKYEEAGGLLTRFEAKVEDVAGRGEQPALPGVGS
jgi:DNA recombination protein RmuC